MKSAGEKWYSGIWSLDIKNQSWVENTQNEVDFIIQKLGLTGKERVLDLACGYGRHALEFAGRGYSVVGVDITKDYIEDAKKNSSGLDAQFIHSDIREVSFDNEFDVVLNLADGAVGYLENDEENLKIFDVISRALKKGGHSFMDIMSGDYADSHYPLKLWDSGTKGITLSKFEWNKKSRILLYGQYDFQYGDKLERFEMTGNPTRLYTENEIFEIMKQRGISVVECFGDYSGIPADNNTIQLMVHSVKI